MLIISEFGTPAIFAADSAAGDHLCAWKRFTNNWPSSRDAIGLLALFFGATRTINRIATFGPGSRRVMWIRAW